MSITSLNTEQYTRNNNTFMMLHFHNINLKDMQMGHGLNVTV